MISNGSIRNHSNAEIVAHYEFVALKLRGRAGEANLTLVHHVMPIADRQCSMRLGVRILCKHQIDPAADWGGRAPCRSANSSRQFASNSALAISVAIQPSNENLLAVPSFVPTQFGILF